MTQKDKEYFLEIINSDPHKFFKAELETDHRIRVWAPDGWSEQYLFLSHSDPLKEIWWDWNREHVTNDGETYEELFYCGNCGCKWCLEAEEKCKSQFKVKNIPPEYDY